MWKGPQTSDRTKNWSLSPSRKVSIDISPATSSSSIKQTDPIQQALIKRPLLYIRLKQMMLGLLLPLRHSNWESP